MAASGGRRLSATAAAAALLGLLTATTPAQATPFVPLGDDPVTAAPTITLTEVTPVVDATEGTRDDPAAATIRGRITNRGSDALVRPSVSVVLGTPTGDRAEIDAWAEAEEPAPGSPVDEATLPSVAPGRSASFTLTVPASDLLPGRSWGVAPVSVQSGQSATRTFVGVHRAKEYEPLRLLWGVPVTLPATTELWEAPGEERSSAWEKAVGEGSPLATTTDRGPGPGEFWLLDPLLLPDAEPEPERELPEREQTVRVALAEAVGDALDPERTIVLPEADADVTAATSVPGRTLVTPRVEGGTAAAEDLGARSDVVWPADGLMSRARASLLRELYGRATTALVPRTALTGTSRTPHAFQAGPEGTQLIVTDPELGALAADTGGTESPVLARQRLVADSAAILGDLPGTVRTIAVVPPRGRTPDPDGYAQLRAATADIPWAEPGELSDGGQPGGAPVDLPRTVTDDPPPVLTPGRATQLLQDVNLRDSLATVRGDTATWTPTITETQVQLTSARWRAQARPARELADRLHTDLTRTERDLRVASGDVNFFADTGRLQVTVENHTDVELDHLQVQLRPDTHILRIDDAPEPIAVGPRSRRTVTVQATALAPGRVPIVVSVTDPAGRQLAPPAELRVRVSPTGSWIYWVIGASAMLLVTLGRWRSVRRRS